MPTRTSGRCCATAPKGTRLARAQALKTYFVFLELRHKVEIHQMTGRVVECPIDEMNRPRGATDGPRCGSRRPSRQVERVVRRLARRSWRPAASSPRPPATTPRAELMAEVGLRVNEACQLDLADVKWELGRFGKLHVRHGKGARGSGPRERMVPLINGAGPARCAGSSRTCGPSSTTTTPGPVRRCCPSERKNTDGTSARVGDEALRAALAEAAQRICRTGPTRLTPHVLRHFCASQLYFGRNGLDRDPGGPRHAWIATTMRYVHVHAHPCRGRLGRRAAAGRGAVERTGAMKWNLRLAAANRGIWKASELQRMLAEHGLVISAGKMSGLWSGQPASIKLDDLDVICAVLGCGVEELLIPEPGRCTAATSRNSRSPLRRSPSGGPAVTPKRRDGRIAPAGVTPPARKVFPAVAQLRRLPGLGRGRSPRCRSCTMLRHDHPGGDGRVRRVRTGPGAEAGLLPAVLAAGRLRVQGRRWAAARCGHRVGIRPARFLVINCSSTG